VEPTDGFLEVVVADEGPGIPQAELTKVFEKFHMVEGRSGGSGLGLAICGGFVEAHGGRIWAESPICDRGGLAVHFTLPWESLPVPAR
jgi:two-component system sensor histidine kinase KdpD